MHVITLDYERCKEKIAVHYGGDASSLVTINRGGLLLDTAEQIGSLIRTIEAPPEDRGGPFDDQEIVHVSNRFATPSPSGYRDLKFYLRNEVGFISTFLVVSRSFERLAFFETSKQEWSMVMTVANTFLDGQGGSYPYVLVRDNFLRDEPDSIHMVSGFASSEEASFYGLSRLNGSLTELKQISRSAQDLIDNWILFGEDLAIVLEDGAVLFDQAIEARIMDCDIAGMPQWSGDDGRDYFKVQISVL